MRAISGFWFSRGFSRARGRGLSLIALPFVLLAVAACSSVPTASAPAPGALAAHARPDWRHAIQTSDHDRYLRLEAAWQTALGQARQSRGSGNLQRLGDLIIPSATLDFVTPPEGDYRCRTIKLGHQNESDGLGYVIYGWFACQIELTPEGLRLTKLTGSQRPSGLLYPENEHRLVFLGSMAVANEPRAETYGEAPDRDMVGVLERVGPTRWRLAVPWPQKESTLDLIELVPAPPRR